MAMHGPCDLGIGVGRSQTRLVLANAASRAAGCWQKTATRIGQTGMGQSCCVEGDDTVEGKRQIVPEAVSEKKTY